MRVRCGKFSLQEIALVVFGDTKVVSGINPLKDIIGSFEHCQYFTRQDN